MRRVIIGLSLLVPLLFPLIYSRSAFVSQSSFPKAIFFYLLSEVIALLFLWYSAQRGSITVPKNYLFLGVGAYILILFITALLGENFRQSFWSYYPHMTGIITWLHFFVYYIVLSSIYKETNWKHFFRALSVSTIVLLIFSYLGPDGFGLSLFTGSGSLLTNNTKSGMYYVLVFFLSFIGFSLEKNKTWRYWYLFILAAIFFSPELFNPDLLAGKVRLGLARASTVVLWFGLIVSAALFFIHKIKREEIKKRFLVGGIIFLLAASGIVFTAPLESLSSRLIVWDGAISAIKQKPLLGYGVENFDYVYQDHFDARVINLEGGGAWFDRAHNFLLDEVTNAGIIGLLIIVALFISTVQMSFSLYETRRQFHFLLIPYIFIFHFIQLQTAFNTITSLFLIFILFAYLSSVQGKMLPIYISAKIKNMIKVASLFLLAVLLYFVVYIPLQQSWILTRLEGSGTFEKRISLFKDNAGSLKNLSISPDQAISRYVNKYISALAPNLEIIYQNNEIEIAKEEIISYLDLYETYYPDYKNKYKFLIYYAHAINYAHLLGVDQLDRGEELSREALEISKAYPQPYLALAINLYNQGRIEEALLSAKQGYDLDRSIVKSREFYEILQTRAKLSNENQRLLYLSDL